MLEQRIFFVLQVCQSATAVLVQRLSYANVMESSSHDTISHILEQLNDITRDRVISFLKKDTSNFVRKFKELVAQYQLRFLPCIHGTKL